MFRKFLDAAAIGGEVARVGLPGTRATDMARVGRLPESPFHAAKLHDRLGLDPAGMVTATTTPPSCFANPWAALRRQRELMFGGPMAELRRQNELMFRGPAIGRLQ